MGRLIPDTESGTWSVAIWFTRLMASSGSHCSFMGWFCGDFIDAYGAEVIPVMDDTTTVAGRV